MLSIRFTSLNGLNMIKSGWSRAPIALLLASTTTLAMAQSPMRLPYTLVDTNQHQCSDTKQPLAACPNIGQKGFGQDAQYQGRAPLYSRHQDGTVYDHHTGLMWTQTPDTNGDGQITATDKLSLAQALDYVAQLNVGEHNDWRLPTIKELYSLMLFDGEDPSGLDGAKSATIRPYLDHQTFAFASGDVAAGERLIDAQFVSQTQYVGTTMGGDKTVFGVNFIDGRIKGYGIRSPRGSGDKTFYVLAVRGNPEYGINQFEAQQDGTLHDHATGLQWQQQDSQQGLDWYGALAYCEQLQLAGHHDWRLPNIKELQSIVDYQRAPDVTDSAAIDARFMVTPIKNEAGQVDYPNYWSSSTHQNLKNSKYAAYVAFGRSLGKMHNRWQDVHGAGAQRSDPKEYQGHDYPNGHSPQGDAIRYDNYARCVRAGDVQQVLQPALNERATKTYSLAAETRPEMPAQTPPAPLNVQQHFDVNGDGLLSYDEVKGPLKNHFYQLDSNQDGYLSADEIPAPVAPK